ncbi:MAG TPA: nuclear transport factor 2 family protein [Solirubrobacteraceae bacterium]|jgi:ketosteroid isomerase-like protein
MSQENVDIVLGMIDAYNSGDADVALAFFTPDVDVFPDALVFPEASVLHGREEFRAWIEEIASAWRDVRWKEAEVRMVDDEVVLYRGEWGGTGIASGIETYSSITGLYTVRDELICRAEWFFDHAKALKAVGLGE